jgi:uncharacterized protein YdaU (DUF1376 family)
MMVSRKDPAFLFYAGDWLLDPHVSVMTLEQQGAYLRLLCTAWLEDGLPNDLEWVRLLLALSQKRFDPIWKAIGPRWVVDGDRLVNRRQETERTLRRERSEEMRALGRLGGKRSAQARGQPDGQAARLPDGRAGPQPAPVKPSTSTSTSTSKKEGSKEGSLSVLTEEKSVQEIAQDLARARTARG